MRDIDLYQLLHGLTPPWRVASVDVTPPVPPSHLGSITVRVEYPSPTQIHCPQCEAIVPGYDSRPRRWRHLNTMQWKTFIESDVPRVNCQDHGVRQIRVAWAEDQSRFTAVPTFETEKGTPNGVPFSVSKVGMVGLKSPEPFQLLTPDLFLQIGKSRCGRFL